MFGTRSLIRLLAAANPDREVTEEGIRRAIRTGAIDAPSTVAGRFVWQDQAIPQIAAVLGLTAPAGLPSEEAAHVS